MQCTSLSIKGQLSHVYSKRISVGTDQYWEWLSTRERVLGHLVLPGPLSFVSGGKYSFTVSSVTEIICKGKRM